MTRAPRRNQKRNAERAQAVVKIDRVTNTRPVRSSSFSARGNLRRKKTLQTNKYGTTPSKGLIEDGSEGIRGEPRSSVSTRTHRPRLTQYGYISQETERLADRLRLPLFRRKQRNSSVGSSLFKGVIPGHMVSSQCTDMERREGRNRSGCSLCLLEKDSYRHDRDV